jgi:prepilin-type processing-associated H-X9-DG protein
MPPLKRRTGLSLVELLVVIFLVIFVIGLLIAFMLPVTRSAGPAARLTQCKNNLHNIGLALHNYHDDYGAFPPAITYDEEGRPLHSWRTLILPYVDHAPLYESIDLSKPWDHPDNAAAAKTCPYPYRCPNAAGTPANCTTYVAIVSTTAAFHPTESRRLDDFSDPTENTLMVIEVSEDDAVPWMAPQDSDGGWVLSFSPDTKLPHEGGVSALFADGSVLFLSAELRDATRRAILTIAGGDDRAISEL